MLNASECSVHYAHVTIYIFTNYSLIIVLLCIVRISRISNNLVVKYVQNYNSESKSEAKRVLRKNTCIERRLYKIFTKHKEYISK